MSPRRLGAVLVAVLGLSAVVSGTSMPDAHADPGDGPTWAWLRAQMGTGTDVTSSSVVVPDEDYAPSWLGEVGGTVQLDPAVPTPIDQLHVEAVVVTDTAYTIATATVGADGRFAFPWSRPGVKVFRLVDQLGTVLAEHAPLSGLVRSFDVPATHHLAGRTFVYDQALALVTAVALGELSTADHLAEGLLRMQTDGGGQDGGFITSAAALNPEAGVPEYRTGNHSVATYALLRYLRDGEPSTAFRATAVSAAQRAVAWLIAQQVPTGSLAGLVRGGHGAYLGGTFDPGHALPWAATEHNVDAWHTLELAATVLTDPAAADAADTLDAAVMDKLWSTTEQRFWQGLSPEGPDYGHALDASSWGAIYLQATGRDQLATQALANLAWFSVTDAGATGYAPVPFPPEPVVWVEGTAGVALALSRVGDDAGAAAAMQAVAPLQSAGVWPGASRNHEWLSMTASPAVAAASWALLIEQALAGLPSIWDEHTAAADGPGEGIDP